MTHTRIEMDTMNATIRSERHLERIADALEGRNIAKILPKISSLLQDYDVKELKRDVKEEDMNFEQKCLLEIGELLNLV